jgi:hypothetical protein
MIGLIFTPTNARIRLLVVGLRLKYRWSPAYGYDG